MLYQVLSELHRLFGYLTVRIGASAATAFVLSMLLGPLTIKRLKRKQIGQTVRNDGPQSHLAKEGTPTMGGILIILSMLIPSLLWAKLNVPYVQVVLMVLLVFGAIGFWDDYKKVFRKNPKGLRGPIKFVLETAIILAAMIYLVEFDTGYTTYLSIPFWKEYAAINLGWFYPIFAVAVIVGSANAVNLTDGLDGLAIFPVAVCAGTYLLFAYIAGRADWSAYLYLPHIKGVEEVAIICAAMVGAGLGFLWFNAHPAQIFMGDVGSLALGGALGIIAVVTKHEFELAIAGGLFVMEAVSVILQVVSFKLAGKRIFRMAPLHHHFELKGWQESKVIVRFWILSFLFAMLALGTLKVR